MLENVIEILETGKTNLEEIQQKFDEMTLAINDLQEAFEDNESELETVTRESIA